MDERALGFLRFTAASAKLFLEPEDRKADKDHRENCATCKEWAFCQIRTSTGNIVGKMRVPRAFLETNSDKQGEFILLSKNIDNEEDEICQYVYEHIDPRYPGTKTSKGIQHADGCEH
jgi:hypothetical protein